jgi:5,10-methylenetetrahydromethanopterin reductase
MMRDMELWLHGFAFPGRLAELARSAEEWGFAGLLVADSQNLTADIWVELALAATATSRVRLGPGVTNPVTRHIAVTASAAATLQAESDGRATLGFAQGDSALSQIGQRRLSVAAFERNLEDLQTLLRGEDVRLPNGAPCRVRWLYESNLPKVPVHVAATGRRTIAAAARHAEGVDLTLGAELERLRWGVATARQEGSDALTVGAYINIAVDPDRDRARELVRGSVATFTRFSSEAESTAALSESTRHGVAQAAAGYQQAHHGEARAGSAKQLDDEFIDRFAIAGPADEVCDRLAAVRDCGIERLVVVPASLDSDAQAVRRSLQHFARNVLPELAA